MLETSTEEFNAAHIPAHQQDDVGSYLPSIRVIKAATYTIRKSWTDEERARRHVIAHSLATHMEGSNSAAVADVLDGAPIRTVKVGYDRCCGVTLVDTDR